MYVFRGSWVKPGLPRARMARTVAFGSVRDAAGARRILPLSSAGARVWPSDGLRFGNRRH